MVSQDPIALTDDDWGYPLLDFIFRQIESLQLLFKDEGKISAQHFHKDGRMADTLLGLGKSR